MGSLDLKLTSSSHKPKHPVETMSSIVSYSSKHSSTVSSSLARSGSFSSNPESPASPVKNKTETSIAEQDLDFNSKTYANELLEHGLKEERFRIDRKKLEDMLQVHQSRHFDFT